VSKKQSMDNEQTSETLPNKMSVCADEPAKNNKPIEDMKTVQATPKDERTKSIWIGTFEVTSQILKRSIATIIKDFEFVTEQFNRNDRKFREPNVDDDFSSEVRQKWEKEGIASLYVSDEIKTTGSVAVSVVYEGKRTVAVTAFALMDKNRHIQQYEAICEDDLCLLLACIKKCERDKD
jgi:hypothetical protein